jgi:hypothetical protein
MQDLGHALGSWTILTWSSQHRNHTGFPFQKAVREREEAPKIELTRTQHAWPTSSKLTGQSIYRKHHAVCPLPFPLSCRCRGVASAAGPFPFLHSAAPFLKCRLHTSLVSLSRSKGFFLHTLLRRRFIDSVRPSASALSSHGCVTR